MDERRRSMGMEMTLKEYVALFEKIAPPCVR